MGLYNTSTFNRLA